MDKQPLIPLDTTLQSAEAKKILEFLRNRIKGQDLPLRSLADVIERRSSPFADLKRPIFVGLFLGPTGVGKTLVAEELARYYFEDPEAFTKISCAELSSEHEVSRLK